MLDSILPFLPTSLKTCIVGLPQSVGNALEEIRIRERRPLEVAYRGEYAFVTPEGGLTPEAVQAYAPSHEDCAALLELLTNHSLYSFEEELKRGYITIPGGHRIGLAGRVVLEQGEVKHLRDVSSFNIRMAREIRDAAKPFLPFLVDTAARTIHHTLIVSPPQQGKTTLARDLARLISYGLWPSPMPADVKGLKVGIVDERSELAACAKGVPRFDVGPRTDVLDGCPKAEGMMMLIRSMSPQVIVADEIGRPEDAAAMKEALHAGIRIVATAHGSGLDDLRRRPVLKELIGEGFFTRFVILQKNGGHPARGTVWDERGNRLEAGRFQPLGRG
jgi:stage III sporulation protein AA